MKLEKIKSWLARRDHSRHEVLIKIQKSCFLGDVECILDQLQEQGYIDDERFAMSRARHRSQQGYGPYRLAAELKEHKLSADLVNMAVASVDWQVAWAIRYRKCKETHKLAATALRTGFPSSFVKEIVSELKQ